MLLDRENYVEFATAFFNDPGTLYLAATVGLFAGVALVLAHNVWSADWRVIITLLGWISVLDSASWLLASEAVTAFWAPLLDNPSWPLLGAAITLILGAALCFFGYMRRKA